ncbi:MAG TPA: hypothetical protein VFN35_17090 [Ktedonobacteraceae bacterium]|nr:hypothetical protein [Ktedonobacteraceae bacterium]
MNFTDRLYIAEEDTQPLLPIASLTFYKYLESHTLTIRDVARASCVRLMVVWNILHDNPILPEDAGKVRTGLFLLTHERYRGPIPVRLTFVRQQQNKRLRFTQELRRV